MVVFRNKDGRLQFSAYLESGAIKTTSHTQNLGVLMAGDLGFSDHIKVITISAFWHLRIS